jgi:hypothetical protein
MQLIVLIIWEAEIRTIMVLGELRQKKVCKTLSKPMAGFVIPVLLCMEVQIEGLWFKLPGHEVRPCLKNKQHKKGWWTYSNGSAPIYPQKA